MSTLNRWVDQRRLIEAGGIARSGPSLPSECRSVKEGEAARGSIVRQLTSLISQIQNSSLGEQRIRVINDEINKLLRSKAAWESQIVKLGGPDYRLLGTRLAEAEGAEIPGQRGYKYFGAAKELPGVRDLLESEETVDEPIRTRREILTNIHSDYYGWKDEHDPELLKAEREAEEANGVFSADALPLFQGEALSVTSDSTMDIEALIYAECEPFKLDKLLLAAKKKALLETYLSRSSPEAETRKSD